MPIPTDYLALVEQLAAKSQEGKVRWRQTRYGGFAVRVGDTDFQVWAGEDESTGREFVSFGLADPGGAGGSRTIDNWSVDAGDEYFDFMYRLFADARRHALGIPQRISALEKALKSSNIIGDEVKPDDEPPF